MHTAQKLTQLRLEGMQRRSFCTADKQLQGILSSCRAHQWKTCDASILWVSIMAPGQEALQQQDRAPMYSHTSKLEHSER